MNKTQKQPFIRLYNIEIAMPSGSFIAYFKFSEDEQCLYITLRTGQQYRCANFTKSHANDLLKAHSRSSYLRQVLVNKADHPAQLIAQVDQATIAQVLMPQTKYGKFLSR